MLTAKQSSRKRRASREEDDSVMELTRLMANLTIGDKPRPTNWQRCSDAVLPTKRFRAPDDESAQPQKRSNKRKMDADTASCSPVNERRQRNLDNNRGSCTVPKKKSYEGPSLVVTVHLDKQSGTTQRTTKQSAQNTTPEHRIVQVQNKRRGRHNRRNRRRRRARKLRSLIMDLNSLTI